MDMPGLEGTEPETWKMMSKLALAQFGWEMSFRRAENKNDWWSH